MRTRALTTSLLLSLTLVAPAFAGDNGEGLVGETNDRIITFFSFGVLAFFIFVVCFMSWVQGRLEKRKEQKKGTDMRQRIGW